MQVRTSPCCRHHQGLTWAHIANDVSKGSFQIKQVFRTFAGANEMLTAAAYQRSAALDAKRQGRYTQLHHGQEMGMLGCIMSIDNEACKHDA